MAALAGSAEANGWGRPSWSKEFGELEYQTMRDAVLATKVRIDGRALDTVRPIASKVGVLPRVHGSSLFTRGETQAIVAVTLGTAATARSSMPSVASTRNTSCSTTTSPRTRWAKPAA
jgi:polyribonucleotide nucleotidyltransferase